MHHLCILYMFNHLASLFLTAGNARRKDMWGVTWHDEVIWVHICVGLRDFERPKCAIWMTCKALVYLLLTWGSDFPVKSWTCFPWWSSIAAAPFQNKRWSKINQTVDQTPPVDADAWSFQSLHHQCCWNCHYWYYYLGCIATKQPSSSTSFQNPLWHQGSARLTLTVRLLFITPRDGKQIMIQLLQMPKWYHLCDFKWVQAAPSAANARRASSASFDFASP